MTGTSSILPQLAEVLTREEAACEQLLATVHRERAAIRRLAIQDFGTINDQRLVILRQLEGLERERRTVLGRAAAAWGLSEQQLTLQVLAERLKESAAPGLDQRLVRLAKTLRTVREEIAFNARLIETVQGFIAHVLSAWTDAAPADGLYSLAGGRRGFGGAAFVEQRG
ncbi:MAG TPA: flagellar protein FlgN [Nitrospira sp.]|nr:flagellar protein FlgN [Nitrospira sp.]